MSIGKMRQHRKMLIRNNNKKVLLDRRKDLKRFKLPFESSRRYNMLKSSDNLFSSNVFHCVKSVPIWVFFGPYISFKHLNFRAMNKPKSFSEKKHKY